MSTLLSDDVTHNGTLLSKKCLHNKNAFTQACNSYKLKFSRNTNTDSVSHFFAVRIRIIPKANRFDANVWYVYNIRMECSELFG